MGWVWKDDDADTSPAGNISKHEEGSGGDRFSTRKIVSSRCRTEETEPGKFIRKCEKTEQVFRDCLGRPSELVQSNKEYTEEDVTDQMMKGSFPLEAPENGPFDFPGLHSDIAAIERSFFSGLNRFFEAAEDMRNGFFNVFGSHIFDGDSSGASRRRGIPVEGYSSKEASPKLPDSDGDREALPKHKNSDGDLDLSGLARDV